MDNQNMSENRQRIEAMGKLLASLRQVLEDLKVLTRFDQGRVVHSQPSGLEGLALRYLQMVLGAFGRDRVVLMHVTPGFFQDLAVELQSYMVEIKKMTAVAIADDKRDAKLKQSKSL